MGIHFPALHSGPSIFRKDPNALNVTLFYNGANGIPAGGRPFEAGILNYAVHKRGFPSRGDRHRRTDPRMFWLARVKYLAGADDPAGVGNVRGSRARALAGFCVFSPR
jgi:hypothetical protein